MRATRPPFAIFARTPESIVLANPAALAFFAITPDAVVLTDAGSFAQFARILELTMFAVTFAMNSAALFFYSTLAKVAATTIFAVVFFLIVNTKINHFS